MIEEERRTEEGQPVEDKEKGPHAEERCVTHLRHGLPDCASSRSILSTIRC